MAHDFVIAYLAKDGPYLRAEHAAGAQYEIDTPASTFDPAVHKHIRKDKVAITGRMVSIYHRTERNYRFTNDHIPIAKLPDWREFFDSTRFGAASPFAIDPTDVPTENEIIENCVITGQSKLTINDSETAFSVSFSFYRQPQ